MIGNFLGEAPVRAAMRKSILLMITLASAPTLALGAGLHDMDVVVDQRLIMGAEGTLQIEVFGATDLFERAAISGAKVRVALVSARAPQKEHTLFSGQTDQRGAITARFWVPELEDGRYTLKVRSSSPLGEGRFDQQVQLFEKTVVRIATDRGIYRPGSVLRYRATVLSGANAHPRARTVALTVRDPRGTVIFNEDQKTDGSGTAIGEVALGDDLIFGRYAINALADEAGASTSVEVKRFQLPAFYVELKEGAVRARYPNGEPVQGGVQLKADGKTFINANLDREGRLSFETPQGAVNLEAQVTDGSRRHQTANLKLPSAPDTLRVKLIPERRRPQRGAPIAVTVLVTDGRGHLAPSEVTLTGLPSGTKKIKSEGATRVELKVDRYIKLEALAKTGRLKGRAQLVLRTPNRGREPQLRLPKVEIEGGASIAVEGRWPKATSAVLLTLLKDGSPVATARAHVDDDQLKGSITPPPGTFGLLTLRANEIGWGRAGILRRSAAALVFVRPTELKIDIEAKARAKPGETVQVRLQVRDHLGQPAAGVSLAASAVDERILALSEPAPDLVEVLETLDVKKAKALGLHFASLLPKQDQASYIARRAILESLPVPKTQPTVHQPAWLRFSKEVNRVGQLLARAQERLFKKTADGGAIVEGPQLLDALPVLLKGNGQLKTPWGQETSWDYANKTHPKITPAYLAKEITTRRLSGAANTLERAKLRTTLLWNPRYGLLKLARANQLAQHLIKDAWGHLIHAKIDKTNKRWVVHLVAPGPDGRSGTKDDQVHLDVFHDDPNLGLRGSGYGGGGFGALGGRSSRLVYGRGGRVQQTMDAPVRKRFDETVLWRAGIVTDQAGRAMIDVPLADSITGFQLKVEAVSPSGSVGVGQTTISTFLPLQLSVDTPRPLTVADRYRLPVIVANHQDTPKPLTVRAAISGAVALEDQETKQLVLAPHSTAAIGFWIKAHRPGEGKLELSLYEGASRVDATLHKVTVVSPGRKVNKLLTAKLDGERTQRSFSMPDPSEVAGIKTKLRIFRGPSDQALDSLEGLLKEPHGCFEQTSSSTYPNLLVLGLLPSTPALQPVRKRAKDLVAKGYQRLISYEVSGGGFSWFGKAPANRVLTAYGLMEFADMAKVYPVDPQLITRTQKWLLSHQRKDGAFPKDEQWLHDWSAVQGEVSTTAYVAWALAESGYKGPALEQARRYLRRNRKTLEDNSYLLGLVAGAEREAKRQRPLMTLDRFRKTDETHRRYQAGTTTLFYGHGQAADVQVTALAASALWRAGRNEDAMGAFDWLWSARQPNYGWGTTQGTVLALRAAAELFGATETTGDLIVRLDERELNRIDLTQQTPALSLPVDQRSGLHTLQLDRSGSTGGKLYADLRMSWRTLEPERASSNGIDVTLKSVHDPKQEGPLQVGQRAKMRMIFSNTGAKTIPWPTGVIPIPPGFSVDPKSLERLRAQGQVKRYEDLGDRVHLYFSKLDTGASQQIEYQLVAEIAVKVLQRGATVYAYYNPETRGSSDAFPLEAIEPSR